MAVLNFLHAIELNPSYFCSYTWLSHSYFCLSKCQEAVDAAAIAIGMEDTDAVGFCCRGKALFGLSQYDAALAGLTKSIEKNPKFNNGEHFYWRAKVYEVIGKNDLAELDRKAAIGADFE